MPRFRCLLWMLIGWASANRGEYKIHDSKQRSLQKGTLDPKKTKVPTKQPTQMSPRKPPTKSPTKLRTKSPTKAPSKPPTQSPTPKPTGAPTVKPTKVPTPYPTILLAPRSEQTEEIISATFIPGGTKDDLLPPVLLNQTSVLEGATSNFTITYRVSGSLTAQDNGIVSLFNLAGAVQVSCDAENKAVLANFSFPVGDDQLPHLFPLGALLVIRAELFGPCQLGKPTNPVAFSDRKDINANGYLIIDQVITLDNSSCVILGRTGNFFSMFSEGSLSIERLSASTDRRSLQNINSLSNHKWHKEHEQDLHKNREGTRSLQGLPCGPVWVSDLQYMEVFPSINHGNSLQKLEAKWNSDGLNMTAKATFELLAVYDLLYDIASGPVTPVEIYQDTCAFNRRLATLPSIMGAFPVLLNYGLPDNLFNIVGESPIYFRNSGTAQSETTGFGFTSRLRFSTGKKVVDFSARGPWDAIKLEAKFVENASGRFTASIFKTPPDIPTSDQVFPERVYPDQSTDDMDFRLEAGVISNLVVYGDLFSASMYSRVGMTFATNDPEASNTPFAFFADGVTPYLLDNCILCPKTIVYGSASTTQMTLAVSLGTFVETDFVGPSYRNNPRLQKSYAVRENPAETLERSAMCLYPQFGFNLTEFCIDQCCNSASGDVCSINFENMNECSKP